MPLFLPLWRLEDVTKRRVPPIAQLSAMPCVTTLRKCQVRNGNQMLTERTRFALPHCHDKAEVNPLLVGYCRGIESLRLNKFV